jgi:hypothetical protein
MHVDGADYRPPSVLRISAVSSRMWVGGALLTVGAHLIVPGAVALVLSLLAVIGVGDEKVAPLVEERHVVAARFVRKGELPDPNKMPNRRVPRKSTAPDNATAVSKNMNPEPPKHQDAGVRPPDPEEDLLTTLGDRAQAFAELAPERPVEGDPNGLEDGTETEAKAGDMYADQLTAFFRRGWSVPNTLTSDELRGKTVRAEIAITTDMHVSDFEIAVSSSLPLLDQSVLERLTQLRELQTTLPEPPLEVEQLYRGQRVVILFKPVAQ